MTNTTINAANAGHQTHSAGMTVGVDSTWRDTFVRVSANPSAYLVIGTADASAVKRTAPLVASHASSPPV